MRSPSVPCAFLASALLAVFCQTASALWDLETSGRQMMRADTLCPEKPDSCPKCVASLDDLTKDELCESDTAARVQNDYRFVENSGNRRCGLLNVLSVLRDDMGLVASHYRASLDEACRCDLLDQKSTFALLFLFEKVKHKHGKYQLPLDHDVKLIQLNSTAHIRLEELLRECPREHQQLRLRRSDSYGHTYGGGSPSYSAPSYSAPSYSAPSYSAPSYSAPYSAPAYSPPSYSAPSYAPPSYSAPSYSPPSYSAPSYSPPSYSAPSYAPPSYSAPSYSAPSHDSYGDSYGDSYSGGYAPSVSYTYVTYVPPSYASYAPPSYAAPKPKKSTFALLFLFEKVKHKHGKYQLPLDHDVKLIQLNSTAHIRLEELLRECPREHQQLRMRRSDSYGHTYGGGNAYTSSYLVKTVKYFYPAAPSYSYPSYSAPSYSPKLQCPIIFSP
ncbi:DNA-directed RNA polymerase II subunit RPB1-like [Ixodes scapularis]